jgi:hypothetical protein
MKYVDQICIDRGGYWNWKSVWKLYLGKPGEYPFCATFLGWYSNKEGFKPFQDKVPYKTGFPSVNSLKKRLRLATTKERTEIELAHY